MKRSIHTRASLALAGFALAALIAATAAAEQAWLGMVSGAVEVGRGDPPVFRAATSGDPLQAGDHIRTGRDGRVELVWRGSTIRLYGDSTLRLPEGQPGVALDRGDGLFDVMKRAGETFEVKTPEVVVSVKGTRFAVEFEENAPSVSVYRGSVGVRGLSKKTASEVMVRAGFRALAGRDGPAELFPLSEADPWQAWGPRAAPPRAARVKAPDLSARGAALRDAKQRARRTYRREVQDHAAKGDSESARRAARLREKRRALGDDRIAPASPSPSVEPVRDPLLDASSEDVEREMTVEMYESWANGQTSDSDDKWEFETTETGDVKVEDTATGEVWILSPDQLEGTNALPEDDPDEFTRYLDTVTSDGS